MRYLILGFTEKGYSIYNIPGVIDYWNTPDAYFYERFKLLGQIILNFPYLHENLNEYLKKSRRYEVTKRYLYLAIKGRKILKSFENSNKWKLLISISSFIPISGIREILSVIDGFIPVLREEVEKFISSSKKPLLLKHVKPYVINVYLWLIRAGIELKKYPNTNFLNEFAIVSFQRLIYHVKKDIWGLDFDNGLSERYLASISIDALFQKVSIEYFLKMVYEKDISRLAQITQLNEEMIQKIFYYWEPIPLPRVP